MKKATAVEKLESAIKFDHDTPTETAAHNTADDKEGGGVQDE